jgi:hypothetical protein
LTVVGVTVVAVGVLMLWVGLDAADKIGSVVGALCGIIGLGVSVYGLVRARLARPVKPEPSSVEPVTAGSVTNSIDGTTTGLAVQIGNVLGPLTIRGRANAAIWIVAGLLTVVSVVATVVVVTQQQSPAASRTPLESTTESTTGSTTGTAPSETLFSQIPGGDLTTHRPPGLPPADGRPQPTRAATAPPQPGPTTITPQPSGTPPPPTSRAVPITIRNNSTDLTLAARAEADLKKDGWNVVASDNVEPAGFSRTTVFYRPATEEEPAATELAARFGMTAEPYPPAFAGSDPGLLVIVANDYTGPRNT